MSEQDKMRKKLLSSVRKSKAAAKPKTAKAAENAPKKTMTKAKPAISPRKKTAPETTVASDPFRHKRGRVWPD